MHICMYIYIYICSPPQWTHRGWHPSPSQIKGKQKTKNKKNKQILKKTKKTIFSKTMGLGPPKDGFFVFLEKKMVFLVRNHLFLEKKMVFGGPSFSRENQKTIFWRPQPHSFGKDGFFGLFVFLIFSRKRWFLVGNHLFLEKKMVLSNHPSKNHLFLEKRWFYQEKTSNPLGIA